MPKTVTPTLKKLLRQLQTISAMVNAQMTMIQKELGVPHKQKTVLRKRPRPVGYARDRLALAVRKRAAAKKRR